MSRCARDAPSQALSYGPIDLRQARGELLPRSGLGLVSGHSYQPCQPAGDFPPGWLLIF